MSKKYIKVTPKGGKPEEARVVLATLETHFRAQKCTIETPTQDEIDEAFPEERIARDGVTTVAKTISDLKSKNEALTKQLADADNHIAELDEELKARDTKIAELEKQLAGADKQPKK